MPNFKPIIPPKHLDHATYETFRRIGLQLAQNALNITAIGRGENPDGSGQPLLDLTKYFYKPGLPGGQLAHGAIEPGGKLTLSSTASPSKGPIYLGSAETSVFDEANERIGLAVAAPSAKLHMQVGAPTGQTPALEAATNSFGFGWGPVGAADLLASLANGDSHYARYEDFGFSANLRCVFNEVLDPGVVTGFTIRFRMRASSGNPARIVMSLINEAGGPAILDTDHTNMFWGGPGNTDFDVNLWRGNVTTSFDEYSYTLTATEVARIDFSQRLAVTFGAPGSVVGRTFDVSEVHYDAPAVGGGSAETLQTWQTPSYSNDLDFTDDGAGSTTLDLSLTGDAPLRIGSGGGTSGLRLLTSSTNARLEVGTAAQANMNLVLSGARTIQGTLLISDFVNSRLTGTIEIRGGSPASGKILTSTNTDGLATWSTPSALATRIQHRWVVNGFYFVDTDWDGAIIVPTAITISSVRLWRRVAGSSGTTEIDVLKNGTTILSAKPSVTSASGNNAIASGTVAAAGACVAGDRLTMDITQAEVDGEDLAVIIEGA